MATYAQVGNVTVEAFQWVGDPLSGYDLPGWTNGSAALHAPTNGMLEVTCHDGRTNARIGDWVVRYETGTVDIIPDELFRLYFNVGPVEAAEHNRAIADAKARENAPVLTSEQIAVRAMQAQAREKVAAEQDTASKPAVGASTPSPQAATPAGPLRPNPAPGKP